MANRGILRFTNNTFKVALLFCLFLICGCSWYSKPAYWGRVADAETGEPLKGVFVNISYGITVQRLVEQGTKPLTEITLITGSDGRFETPPIRTFIGPLSWDFAVSFSADKQGYAGFGQINIADCMSTGCEETTIPYIGDPSKEIVISSHLIRLPRLKEKATVPIAPPSDAKVHTGAKQEMPLMPLSMPYEILSIQNDTARIKDRKNARVLVVQEGDTLEDGWTVIAIDKDEIILEKWINEDERIRGVLPMRPSKEHPRR